MWLIKEVDEYYSKTNGYNEEYISRVIKEFLERKSTKKVIYSGPEKYKIYISLPYLGDTSEKIRGNIKSCLSRIKCGSLPMFENTYHTYFKITRIIRILNQMPYFKR